ncbi:aromatic acid exporter family protein [Streptomyces sp. NWU339]|uniref:FUSC family protein n=1 Tax=Streptomyces sp. NWU339 TaxID=2185284 RepID=UPI0015E81819|nr:FUSC family protein [Streptomyces sp. NWU339]
MGRSARSALRRPGPERDTMVQSLKAAGAAIAAWALTGWWLEAPMALLAPWTAIVLVASTVYRSVHSGVQQFAVIVVGTLWASAALAVAGNSTLGAMALTLPPLVLIGNYRRLGSQGIYGATTALFVITYGASAAGDVGHRLLETLIGAVVGIAVNAFVLPPVHLRSVRENLHGLVHHSGELLASVAEGLREEDGLSDAAQWHDRARRLGGTVQALADARRWTSESYRFNPGRRMRRNGPALPPAEADVAWERISGHLVAITRTLDGAAGDEPRLVAPSSACLARCAEVLGQAATVCRVDAEILEQAGRSPSAAQQDRRDAALEEALTAHDALITDIQREEGAAVATGGELVVETHQLLCELANAAERRRRAPAPER